MNCRRSSFKNTAIYTFNIKRIEMRMKHKQNVNGDFDSKLRVTMRIPPTFYTAEHGHNSMPFKLLVSLYTEWLVRHAFPCERISVTQQSKANRMNLIVMLDTDESQANKVLTPFHFSLLHLNINQQKIKRASLHCPNQTMLTVDWTRVY